MYSIKCKGKSAQGVETVYCYLTTVAYHRFLMDFMLLICCKIQFRNVM